MITNFHVVKTAGIADSAEVLGIVIGNGGAGEFRAAKLAKPQPEYKI